MSSRTTTLLTATAISVSALVAYALYFDYKRRTDSAFRKQLRKQKKRVDKSLAESREALQAASQVTDEELREALKAIEEEPKPGPELRENYFMSQVAMGEQLAARGEAFVLPAALSFYRALAVYPSPSELLGIYQKTVPDEIVKVILRIINLDVSAPPQDLGIDEGDASPTRGPPSETSSQEWDKVTDPGSQTPVSLARRLLHELLSNIIISRCLLFPFGPFSSPRKSEARVLFTYYEVFPPKSSHVTIQPRPDVPVSFGPEKVLVLTEDVAAGQVIYKEKPMLACLDYDLQTAGTHCTHCFRELSTVASPETLTSSADSTKSKFCSKACLQAAKTRWFGFLMSMDPPLPAIVELGGLPVTPETLDARRAAQAQLVAYLKKDSRAGAFLVAQFIARQLTMAGSKDLNPEVDFAGVDIQEYRIEDHVERWTTAPISPPEEEYGLLVAMLKATLPGLEEFLSEDSHKSLVGKLVFAAFGVCFGEGREDRPASSLRPEDSELTRTPLGTARQVGTAIYSISSHLPHSCEPNARPVFSSGTTELEIVASKDLQKGDQLSIAYVEVGQRPDESEKDCRLRRRKELARGWKFACQCPRCAAEATSS
ncbi:SET domain-containing protein [Mycena chlorophos]|uniref:SET domain-containing protein n=1 Tax=Mycena chlorophos TaxID=658473 RepID=A0A8H6VXZ7_MYCCL|nr:SET domain-containing protein [Mycena chlorophos]